MAALLTPRLAALLHDAALCARRGEPLRYCKEGFRNLARAKAPAHSFLTVRAAERRGLVMTSGEAPHRVLHITGRGLDIARSARRR